MAVHRGYSPGIVGGGGGAATLEEVSSTSFDHQTSAVDPWDNTVAIPTGSNRFLIDALGITTPGTDSSTIDPGGGDEQALTEITGSPQVFSGETAVGWALLEAGMPATPNNYTLRYEIDAARRGGRRVIVLRNARQVISSNGANHDANTGLQVSTTRNGGGNFPAGTLIYAWCHAESDAQPYTVSGDVTEVEDISDGNSDRWIFASGVLGSPAASVSATFTRGGTPATVRKNALIIAVEQSA